MDPIDQYLVSRCAALASALDDLDALPWESRTEALDEAARLLRLLSEALCESEVGLS